MSKMLCGVSRINMDCYICSDCGERVDEEVEISKDEYGCPYCKE